MKEGGTTAQVADNEQRFLDDLLLMAWKENIIQEEAQPMDELSYRPNGIEHEQEYDALACQMSGGVFGSKERAICGSPKEAEIGIHSVRDPYSAFMEKAHSGFLCANSIRNYCFWINRRLWFHVYFNESLDPLQHFAVGNFSLFKGITE